MNAAGEPSSVLFEAPTCMVPKFMLLFSMVMVVEEATLTLTSPVAMPVSAIWLSMFIVTRVPETETAIAAKINIVSVLFDMPDIFTSVIQISSYGATVTWT
jgi:hypothetical protein